MIVREDLPPGLQLAQAVHAAGHLAEKGRMPECVIVLGVPSEPALTALATDDGVLFHEPDLGGQATAFAVISDGRAFSALPLAGRAPVPV